MAEAAARRGFELVEDDEPATVPPRKGKPLAFAESAGSSDTSGAAVAAVTFALRALSQRALIAIADLFTLITVLTAFWLYMSIPNPNPNQLIGMGMYSLFVLVANVIVRRKT